MHGRSGSKIAKSTWKNTGENNLRAEYIRLFAI